MKSVKLKVSLIANLIAVVCLIILGVVTFINIYICKASNFS